MMLILQIILTIIAWRNGWGWLSLLPIIILFVIAGSIGFGIGLSGGSPSDFQSVFLLDVLSIVALIVMCFKSPKIKTNN